MTAALQSSISVSKHSGRATDKHITIVRLRQLRASTLVKFMEQTE